MERRNSVNAIKDLAYRACYATSFDPEKRGEQLMDGLEQELQSFLSQIPEEIRPEMEASYISKYCDWLGCMSRCFSVMITGAGNFNHRRHEKTNNAEQNARKRLDEWSAKVIARCNHQAGLTGWEEVERLQIKHDKLVAMQERMKATNKIIRDSKMSEVEKWDELVAMGWREKHIPTLFEPDYAGRIGFASYMLSNNLAEIKRLEGQIQTKSNNLQKTDETTEYAWGSLEYCYSEERIRFRFDSIPGREVIQILKSNAFKWSPRNEAWQRQITNNSIYATKRVLSDLVKLLDPEESKE